MGLKKVIDDNLAVCDLLNRAADRKLFIDKEQDIVLDGARVPSSWYTRVLREGWETMQEHPILSEMVIFLYSVVDNYGAKKREQYSFDLLCDTHPK